MIFCWSGGGISAPGEKLFSLYNYSTRDISSFFSDDYYHVIRLIDEFDTEKFTMSAGQHGSKLLRV
jgi:hypothetical protein